MKKSLSLNELMIAVAVVGILAVIAVPQYFKIVEKTRAQEGEMTLHILRDFQLRYYAEENKFTKNISDLGLSGSDLNSKYFENPQVYNPPNLAANKIASVDRDRSVHNGPADYTLNIKVNGEVYCSTSADDCAKSGYKYEE